jgi:hypothetical protein
MNSYINKLFHFGSTEADFMSDSPDARLSLAMNQYVKYWKQYYAQPIVAPTFGRHAPGHRRPRHWSRPPHWANRHPHWRRRWRRRMRPMFIQPIAAPVISQRGTIAVMLQTLSDKINLTWSSMTEAQRMKWRKTREKPYQKSPRLLFSKFPLPAGI